MSAGNTRKQIKRNQSGVVLFSVVVMAMILMILVVAIMTFVSTASKQSTANFSDEQAYYIASSSLKTFVDYVNDENNNVNIAKYIGKSGQVQLNNSSTINGAGNCTISVASVSTNTILVKAESTYAGETAQAVAYYKIETSTKSKKLSNAIESSSGILTDQAISTVGDTVVDSTKIETHCMSVTNQTNLKGTIRNKGNILFGITVDTKWVDNISGNGSYITSTESIILGAADMNPSRTKDNDTDYSTIDDSYSYISVGKYYIARGGQTDESGKEKYIGHPGHEMDVYCKTAYLGGFTDGDDAKSDSYISSYYGTLNNRYIQYGNLYCYKTNDGSSQDGSLIIASANETFEFLITGDVYVDGNIEINSTSGKQAKIDGDLYISNTTKITSTKGNKITVTGKVYCNTSGMDSTKKDELQEMVDKWITTAGTTLNTPTNSNVNRAVKPSVEIPKETFTYQSVENILNGTASIPDDSVFKDYSSTSTTIKKSTLENYRIVDDYPANTGGYDYYINGNCSIPKVGVDTSIYIDINDSSSGNIIIQLPDTFNFESGSKITLHNTKIGAYKFYFIFGTGDSKTIYYTNSGEFTSVDQIKALDKELYAPDETNIKQLKYYKIRTIPEYVDKSKFNYYVDENCYIDTSELNKGVYIDVDKYVESLGGESLDTTVDRSMVIILSNKLTIKAPIVVKNSTKYFCYFVVDSQDGATSKLTIDNGGIYSDIVYNYLINGDGDKYLNLSLLYDSNGEVINTSSNSVVIDSLVKTFILMPDSSELAVENSGVAEAVLYGPGAKLSSNSTYALNISNYDGSVKQRISNITFIGASVFKNYTMNNDRTSIYALPMSGSIIEQVNGGGTKTETVFDHYEIR